MQNGKSPTEDFRHPEGFMHVLRQYLGSQPYDSVKPLIRAWEASVRLEVTVPTIPDSEVVPLEEAADVPGS